MWKPMATAAALCALLCAATSAAAQTMDAPPPPPPAPMPAPPPEPAPTSAGPTPFAGAAASDTPAKAGSISAIEGLDHGAGDLTGTPDPTALAPNTGDELRFSSHGYFRAPMRIGIGSRPGCPAGASPGALVGPSGNLNPTG